MSVTLARRALVASLFAFPLSAQQPVAPALTTSPIPQIQTVGVGEAKVTPDRARIQIAVQSRATTAAVAAAANARKQRAVIDTLRAIGFPADRLTTTGYSVQPEMEYDKNGGAPRVVGYVVVNSVRADAPRFDLIAPAIDAALAKGANSVDQLELYSSRADEARRASLADAVSKARADADAIARAAGGSVGRLLELVSGEQSSPVQPFAVAAVRMAKESSTPIEPGEATIRSSVSARWEFLPGPR